MSGMKNYRNLFLSENSIIQEVLKIIDSGAMKIGIVVDENEKLMRMKWQFTHFPEMKEILKHWLYIEVRHLDLSMLKVLCYLKKSYD